MTQSSAIDPCAGGDVLRLYPLIYLDEGDEVTVGRVDVDEYVVLPADGAALLRQLAAGLSPQQAADWYATTYAETVNIGEFVETISELGFVMPDGAADDSAIGADPVRWQRLGQAVFSPLGALIWLTVVVAGVITMVRTPAVAPRFQHIFVSDYLIVIELVIFLGQIPLVLLHESAHALAGRRLGLRTSLSVGRRLYFVVFETRMDGLVAVPRRQRYLPMLAGLLADVLVMCGLTLIAGLLGGGSSDASFLAKVLLSLAFGTMLRAIWQFYFYLQTDLYYVFVTVLGCHDLQNAAKRMLANRWWRLLRRPDRMRDENELHPRDRQVGRYYRWLVLAGYTFSILALVVFVIPATWNLGVMVTEALRPGSDPVHIADGIAFTLLNLGQFVLAYLLARRDRRRRRSTLS